jgi:DNA-binding response OmpR family regulator
LSDTESTLRVTILLVCPNEERLNRLKDAMESGGFRTISARALDDAWVRTDLFDVSAVLIDHELKNDIVACALRQRFLTLNLKEDASPEVVVMELANLFSSGSELVQ